MSDEEKMVKVVWTWQRPNSQERLENILAVAFEAALSVDPDVTEINIRAEPHEHTYTNGQWRDEIPHVTMSIRNEQQIINGSHTLPRREARPRSRVPTGGQDIHFGIQTKTSKNGLIQSSLSSSSASTLHRTTLVAVPLYQALEQER
ncbi:hypothetical protein IWX50DRAFT_198170 [Phyllosticta citricarpa]